MPTLSAIRQASDQDYLEMFYFSSDIMKLNNLVVW